MLAIEIELLAGRYVASRWNNRDEPEWPPHPARVFSAIVAACWEAGGPDVLERQALEWLQALPPPTIVASQAVERTVVRVFVPVNDTSHASTAKQELVLLQAERELESTLRDGGTPGDLAKHEKNVARRRDALRKQCAKYLSEPGSYGRATVTRARASIPLYRPRKERRFPSVTPHDARVQLVWKDARPGEAIRAALQKAVSRASYLGHSSSLVRCSLVDEACAPTWVPDEIGSEVLRVPGPDQLAKLEAAYGLHRGLKPRVLPYRPQRYRYVADKNDDRRDDASRGYFDTNWIVFQHEGRLTLPIERAVHVASGMKDALAKVFRRPEFIKEHALDPHDPVPEVVSGLTGEQRPLQRPHVAFAALPFVDHAHADGHLMGVAAILPCSMDAEERRTVLAALGQVRTLKIGPRLQWTLRRLTPALARPFSLQSSRWCRRAFIWATVTPILLDRFPGNLGSRAPETASRAEAEAKETIKRACERIGLPRPRTIELVALPPFQGLPPAMRFHRPAPKPSRPRRVAVHAIIDFGVPVQGPVLVGAGRYLGLGLCAPVTEQNQ